MPGMASEAVQRARDAVAVRDWAAAYDGFASEPDRSQLELNDLEWQAVAAHLIGRNDASREALAEGYREAMRLGERRRAALFAFWVGHGLMFDGGVSEAAGWFARARQLVVAEGDCVEGGYLLIPDGIACLDAQRPEDGVRLFMEARGIADRFGDNNLRALAGHGLGRALIRMGRIAEGMAVLDEVIVHVTSREVTPMAVGDVYCGVLEACHEVFDLRRAREWTGALTRWCEAQNNLVAYRGPCMVYRAEVMQFHGDWSAAFEEAQRACDWLSGGGSPEGPGDAFYRIGELQRLQGAYEQAEEAYHRASRLGRPPEPGLPLLWLAQGRPDAARAAIRRALSETADEPGKRATLLDADIEVSLALGDIAAARGSARELAETAERLDAAHLRAAAAMAEGRLLLAEGQPPECLAPLRRAWGLWRHLEAPHEAARVRVLIGEAYRLLGDAESAEMEFDAARWVFEELHAAPDLARLESPAHPERPGGLTSREVEVLQLVAAGQTNRQIAASLVISEHTVARHVQNMLGKLSCASRASLAAFAVEHGLAPGANG